MKVTEIITKIWAAVIIIASIYWLYCFARQHFIHILSIKSFLESIWVNSFIILIHIAYCTPQNRRSLRILQSRELNLYYKFDFSISIINIIIHNGQYINILALIFGSFKMS